MIDIEHEKVFLLSDGPKHVNKSRSRLNDYICCGIRRNKDQEQPIIYLESVQLPSGKATSVEAYNRFLIAINVPPNGDDSE